MLNASSLTDLDSMKFSGSMFTLAAPQLATAGALVGSLVAGDPPIPNLSSLANTGVILVSGMTRHLVDPADLEDRADRDVSVAEFSRWGRSMIGGDTSDMLDIQRNPTPRLFAEALRTELSQGDLYPAGWKDHRSGLVVLSHDCDVDKSLTTLVVDLVPGFTTSPSLLGDIKRGRVFHAFYLEGMAVEAWANLRTIHGVDRDELLATIDLRTYSMTDEGRLALAAKVFGFLTRSLPPVVP